jgi:hypothetical protein
MEIFRSREMLRGLDISHVTLNEWVKQGMDTIKQNPYLFDKKAMEWVIKNKPDYAEKAKQMMEG